MERTKRRFLKGLSLTLLLGLTACGNAGNKTASENSEVDFFIAKRGFPDVHPNSNEMWMWEVREKESGVTVKFDDISDATLSEKKNIMLSSSNQPDAYYGMNFSNSEIAKYGSQGLFIPLEDLIEEHAPNLSKIFEDYPDVKASLTQPDGHIYALPHLQIHDPNTKKIYFNKEWLENLGLEVPNTLDEFYNVLHAFVNDDPNGNGEQDETGWYTAGDNNLLGSTLERQIMGAYGLINGGDFATSNLFYVDESGQNIKMTVTDPKYKEVLKFENKLFSEGLIHSQTFSNIERDKWLADGAKGVVGAYTEAGPAQFGDQEDNYVGITALEGPYGDQLAVAYPLVGNPTSFMVTKASEKPAELIAWIDYMYSEEGTTLGTFGVEGETYHIENNVKVYDDKILNYDDGVQLGAFQWVENVYGGGYPYVEPSFADKAAAERDTEDGYFQWANEKSHSDDYIPVLIGDLTQTEEEVDEIAPLITDIGKYVTQMRVDFVTGKVNIDEEWDNYVEQIRKLGGDRYIEIKEEQFNRYMDAIN